MKCQVPQISWHGRDPVLSVDFQVSNGSLQRLATGGTDSHVFIWYVVWTPNKPLNLAFASDLSRHTKPVNIVRFSPDGEILASGDDESVIILWKLSEREVNEAQKDEENANKEYWYPSKVLRGHLDDICDISWSPDSSFLFSGSVDNTSILWDIPRAKKLNIFSEYRGFVQGVSWDPSGQYLASISSDRTLRIHSLNTKKTVYKVQKANFSAEKNSGKPSRLFYDDTLKSFCRRLSFSPDGELLIVPSGILDMEEGKVQNTTYVFTRYSLNKPVIHLPTGSKYTLAVRCSPVLYKLREPKENENSEMCDGQTKGKSLFGFPYRTVFAVAAQGTIFFYDTQQVKPFAFVSNIHYTHLTDLAWSPDGLILIASSTDGYCSLIMFNKGEIGEPYEKPVVDTPATNETSDNANMSPSSVPSTDNTPSPSIPVPASVAKPLEEKSPESPTNKSTSKIVSGPKKNSIVNFLVSPSTKENNTYEGQALKNDTEEMMDIDPPTAVLGKKKVMVDIPIITIDDDCSNKMDQEINSCLKSKQDRGVFPEDIEMKDNENTIGRNEKNTSDCTAVMRAQQEMKSGDKCDSEIVVAPSNVEKVVRSANLSGVTDTCKQSKEQKSQAAAESEDSKSVDVENQSEAFDCFSENSSTDFRNTQYAGQTPKKRSDIEVASEHSNPSDEAKATVKSSNDKKSGRRVQLITLCSSLKS